MPRAESATVRRQNEPQRDIVHLFYATPALRGEIHGANIQPIQELITLADIEVTLQTDHAVKRIRTVPEGESLTFSQ